MSVIGVRITDASAPAALSSIHATYSLDGLPSTTASPSLDPGSPSRVLLFVAASLEPGAHTLVMSHPELQADPSYLLDYITYTPSLPSGAVLGGETSSDPSSPQGSSENIGPGTSSSVASYTAAPVASPLFDTVSSNSSTHGSFPMLAIILISVIAGTVFLALVALLLWPQIYYWMKDRLTPAGRRRLAEKKDLEGRPAHWFRGGSFSWAFLNSFQSHTLDSC